MTIYWWEKWFCIRVHMNGEYQNNVREHTKYLITLRKKILREENFANFANFDWICETKFLFWLPKMSICENEYPRNFWNWWFAKINSRKLSDMRLLQFLSDTVSFESGLLETIGYFVICLSKKVFIFTEIVLKTID